MEILLIINSELLANAFKRYLLYLHSFNTTFTFLDNYSGISPNVLYSFDLYMIDIYGSANESCALGLHLGTILENQKKIIAYFYTASGLKKEYKLNTLLSNCFYLPVQLKSFLNFLKQPQKSEISASELLQMFHTTSITSGHH